MKDKNKETRKKKLTISSSIKRPSNPINFTVAKNRTSVVIEKRTRRKSNFKPSNFKNKNTFEANVFSSSKSKGFSSKKPFYNKNFEMRKQFSRLKPLKHQFRFLSNGDRGIKDNKCF